MLRDRRSHDLDDNGLNRRFRSAPLRIYGPGQLPLDQRSRSLRNFRLQEFEISNPTSFILQSSGVDDLQAPVLLNQWSCLHSEVVDLSTQINGPMTLFSIDGRDLLRVSGLLRSQLSNLFFPMAFTQSLRSTDACLPKI
jgi:hypothetical protein